MRRLMDVAHLPWHSVDDLGRCLGLERTHRRIMRSKYLAKKWPKGAVAIGDEIIAIAPQFAAQGTIDGLVEIGRAPASVRLEYDRAGAEALKKLMAPLPFSFGSDACSGGRRRQCTATKRGRAHERAGQAATRHRRHCR